MYMSVLIMISSHFINHSVICIISYVEIPCVCARVYVRDGIPAQVSAGVSRLLCFWKEGEFMNLNAGNYMQYFQHLLWCEWFCVWFADLCADSCWGSDVDTKNNNLKHCQVASPQIKVLTHWVWMRSLRKLVDGLCVPEGHTRNGSAADGWCAACAHNAVTSTPAALLKCLCVCSGCTCVSEPFKSTVCNTSFLSHNAGCGHGWRRVVTDWYLRKEPMELSECVTKFRGQYGWTHRDIIKLSHPKSSDVGNDDSYHKRLFFAIINSIFNPFMVYRCLWWQCINAVILLQNTSVVWCLCKASNVSETGFCLHLQVECTQLGPLDRIDSYLGTPTPTPTPTWDGI